MLTMTTSATLVAPIQTAAGLPVVMTTTAWSPVSGLCPGWRYLESVVAETIMLVNGWRRS